MATQPKTDLEALDDRALATLVAARDPAAVRLVARRNNQRLFRAAWAILRDRAAAEDAVQNAYLRAFAAIGRFEGRSALSTWLTRITINEALGIQRSDRRRRARLDSGSVAVLDDYRETLMRGSLPAAPDAEHARGQVRALLERAIAELPAEFRIVFVLREVEALSVDETAEALGLVPATVKTRHLRARRRLRDALEPELRAALDGAFPFAGADCERVTERVAAAWCGQG